MTIGTVDTPEEDNPEARQAFSAFIALTQGADFRVLTPEAYEDFMEGFSALVAGHSVGEFCLQLFMYDPSETDEDRPLWLGIIYDYVEDDDGGYTVDCKGYTIPEGRADISQSEIPEVAGLSTIVLQITDLDQRKLEAWGTKIHGETVAEPEA